MATQSLKLPYSFAVAVAMARAIRSVNSRWTNSPRARLARKTWHITPGYQFQPFDD